MKKKIYGFLLGATMLVIGGVGVFSAFEAEAGPIYQNYLYSEIDDCIWEGDNCLATVWIDE